MQPCREHGGTSLTANIANAVEFVCDYGDGTILGRDEQDLV